MSNVNNLVADDDGRLEVVPTPPASPPKMNLDTVLPSPQSAEIVRKKDIRHRRVGRSRPLVPSPPIDYDMDSDENEISSSPGSSNDGRQANNDSLMPGKL